MSNVGLSISDLSGPYGSVIPSSAITFNAPDTIAAGTESNVTFQLAVPTVVGSYQGSIQITSKGGNCTVPVEIDIWRRYRLQQSQ